MKITFETFGLNNTTRVRFDFDLIGGGLESITFAYKGLAIQEIAQHIRREFNKYDYNRDCKHDYVLTAYCSARNRDIISERTLKNYKSTLELFWDNGIQIEAQRD